MEKSDSEIRIFFYELVSGKSKNVVLTFDRREGAGGRLSLALSCDQQS